MNIKDMRFEDEARKSIFLGVAKLAKAVKSTLGPTGRNVLIKRNNAPPIITKDGVTVAKEVVLEDPYENLGAELVREVASKTATVAGDGTTTATVLAEAILIEGAKHLEAGVNATELKRGIDLAVKAVINHLSEMSTPIKNKENMLNVATISSNGDAQIGELLADLVDDIGSEGIATIDRSGSENTYVERVDGLQILGGLSSPYFANKEDGTAVWDDPYILIYDGRITSAKDLALGNGSGFLEKIVATGKPLVIIAEGIDGEALHILVVNRLQQASKFLSVKLPFVPNQTDLLQDIATLTGGRVFSKEMGHKLHKIDLEHLGSADRVVATKDKTLILRGKGKQEDIETRISNIRTEMENAKSDNEKRLLKERAAKLKNGVSIIYVGGSSEVEQRERHDRVEDALYATQAAVEDGIIPGGGVALARCIGALDELLSSNESEDQKRGIKIIQRALSSPLKQIAENASKSGDVVLEKVLSSGYGYDARNDKYCDLMKEGIIDPTKVAKSALQNAASVAGLMLTTDAVLVERALESK